VVSKGETSTTTYRKQKPSSKNQHAKLAAKVGKSQKYMPDLRIHLLASEFLLVQKNELTNNIKFNSTIDLLSDVNTHIAHQICVFVRFPTTFSTSTR